MHIYPDDFNGSPEQYELQINNRKKMEEQIKNDLNNYKKFLVIRINDMPYSHQPQHDHIHNLTNNGGLIVMALNEKEAGNIVKNIYKNNSIRLVIKEID